MTTDAKRWDEEVDELGDAFNACLQSLPCEGCPSTTKIQHKRPTFDGVTWVLTLRCVNCRRVSVVTIPPVRRA